jgi:general secretion pathway protein H
MSMRAVHDEANSARDAGFTLVEILFALAVLAVALVALQPLLRPPSADRVLEACTRQLAADLRSARLHAIRNNRQALVRIDLGERSYLADGMQARQILPPHVDITATSTISSGSSIGLIFFPDGSANGGNVRLSMAGRTNVIVIDWLSGQVRTSSGGT